MGISGTTSFLEKISFSVSFGGLSSAPAPLLYGVPQGSVLSCILFSLYVLSLSRIMNKRRVSHHCYTDDTQVYLPVRPGTPGALKALFDCLEDMKHWMADSFLKLNETKTEILIFGPPEVAKNVASDLGPLLIYCMSNPTQEILEFYLTLI